MSIIILYTIILIILYLFLCNNRDLGAFTTKKVFLFFSSLLLICLYLLIDTDEFPDLPVYEDFFDYIIVNGEINRHADVLAFEKGYVWLNIFARLFSENFIIIRIILSVFAAIIIANSAYKYSSIVWLTYVLYICVVFYSTIYILRQAFAIFIIVYSYRYIICQDFKRFIVCLLCAFLFHKSSIICLSLYFLYSLRINFKTLSIVGLCTIILSISFSYVLNFASFLINDIGDYITQDATNISLVSLMIPFSSLVFSLICLKNSITDYNRLFIWMGVVECMLTTLSFIVVEFGQFYRLILYFSMAKTFLLPNAIKSIRSLPMRYTTCAIWVVCWLFYFNVTSLYGFEMILQ